METLPLEANYHQVSDWLRAQGEEKAAKAAVSQRVDGKIVPYLDHLGWSELGIDSAVKRARLLAQVETLRGISVGQLSVETGIAQSTLAALPWNDVLVPFIKSMAEKASGHESEERAEAQTTAARPGDNETAKQKATSSRQGVPVSAADAEDFDMDAPPKRRLRKKEGVGGCPPAPKTSARGQAEMRRQIGHYDALRILRTAPQSDVHTAYRARARETHPDKTRGDSAPFVSVNAAFSVLSDADRRAAYDRKLQDSGSLDGTQSQDTPLPAPARSLQSAENVRMWKARCLHTVLLLSPQHTWHEQARKQDRVVLDALLAWMTGEANGTSKVRQDSRIKQTKAVQSCEGIRRHGKLGSSYEVFCMFSPWELRSYAPNLELAADRRAALVCMKESLAARRGGKGGEPVLSQHDVARGLEIEPTMKFALRFDAKIENTKKSGPFMQPVEAFSPKGQQTLSELAQTFRGPGALTRVKNILQKNYPQLAETKKKYLEADKALYCALLEVRNAQPAGKIHNEDNGVEKHEPPAKKVRIDSDPPIVTTYSSSSKAKEPVQPLALPPPAPRVARTAPKPEVPETRSGRTRSAAVQGGPPAKKPNVAAPGPRSFKPAPFFALSKDTLELLCSGLQIQALCRLQMISKKSSAVLQDKVKRRLVSYVHYEDSVETSDISQRGRRRPTRKADKNNKLIKFLCQPNYAADFQTLDLRNAPTDVLQDKKLQQGFLHMTNLTHVIYPQSGWPDGVGHARFVALFPYSVKVEAQRPTSAQF